MSARLICPLLSFLLHVALFYAISDFSWQSPVKVKSGPQQLQLVLVQPKQQTTSPVTAAKPMLPTPPVKKIKQKAEIRVRPAEKKIEIKTAPPPGKEPAPKRNVKNEEIKPKKIKPQRVLQPETISPLLDTANIPSASQKVEGPADSDTAAVDNHADINSPQTAQANIVKLEQEYRQELLRAISQHKKYPDSARRRGHEGEVQIRFSVLQDGTISQVTIAETSGRRDLDQAAIRSLKRLQRFKPIPQELKRNNWQLLVKIHFSLD